MPTSLDVAKKAGVSQSAVSRVFTPGASVSDTMRSKVLKAAGELGYRPNVLARSLITGRSHIIGLVVAYLDNQYYPLVLEQMSKTLQDNGYHLLVFMASQNGADVDKVLAEILDYQVDGIVMASVGMSSDIAQRCAAAGVPVVLFNRTQDNGDFNAVTSDNHRGGRTLARFLTAGEHKRIAYIAGWEEASTQRDREAGFLQGLADAGQTLFAREVGNYTFEGAQQATRRLFTNPSRPDAIFVANDHMAIATMDVLRHELGLRVPEDVSVVSYDDVPQAAWPSYAITSVRQPTGRMIRATIDMLIARIEEGDDVPRQTSFAGPLIIRKSARVPKNWSQEGCIHEGL